LSQKRYVFDAYAILALIEDEPGAQTIAEIITAQEPELFMSIISLGEIYYILLRKKSEQAAEEVVKNIFAEESLILVEASWKKVKDAARIKAKGGLSYADSLMGSTCFFIPFTDSSIDLWTLKVILWMLLNIALWTGIIE